MKACDSEIIYPGDADMNAARSAKYAGIQPSLDPKSIQDNESNHAPVR